MTVHRKKTSQNVPSEGYPQKNTEKHQKRLTNSVQTISEIRILLNVGTRGNICDYPTLLAQIFRDIVIVGASVLKEKKVELERAG